jgi:hypothetical protein
MGRTQTETSKELDLCQHSTKGTDWKIPVQKGYSTEQMPKLKSLNKTNQHSLHDYLGSIYLDLMQRSQLEKNCCMITCCTRIGCFCATRWGDRSGFRTDGSILQLTVRGPQTVKIRACSGKWTCPFTSLKTWIPLNKYLGISTPNHCTLLVPLVCSWYYTLLVRAEPDDGDRANGWLWHASPDWRSRTRSTDHASL